MKIGPGNGTCDRNLNNGHIRHVYNRVILYFSIWALSKMMSSYDLLPWNISSLKNNHLIGLNNLSMNDK